MTEVEKLKEKLQSKNIEINNLNKKLDALHKIKLEEIEYIIKKHFEQINNKYNTELRSFVDLTNDKEEFFKEVYRIIENVNKSLFEQYWQPSFDEVKEIFKEHFVKSVSEFLDMNKIDNNIRKYLEKQIKDYMKTFKNKELEKVLGEVYSQVGRKYNVTIAKDIVNKMSEMQTIHTQDLISSLKKISNKEKLYLADKNYSSKQEVLDYKEEIEETKEKIKDLEKKEMEDSDDGYEEDIFI